MKTLIVLTLSAMFWSNAVMAASELVKTKIGVVARDQGVDPLLLQAIAFVESSYNPKAIGKLGELGLFQLRPEFHEIKPNMTTKQQTLVAIKYIKKLKSQCGEKFLQCWNMGPRRAKEKKFLVTNYELKVQDAYKDLLHSRSFSSIKSKNIAREVFK